MVLHAGVFQSYLDARELTLDPRRRSAPERHRDAAVTPGTRYAGACPTA